MAEITRRSFGRQTLDALLTFSVLEAIMTGDVLGAPIKPVAAKWLEEINMISKDTKAGKLTQVQWQAKVEQLFDQVDLPELLTYVDFKTLISKVKYPDNGAKSIQASFPEVEGLPTRLEFGHQIFAMKKGRSIVPHGHNNMATAFIVLDGKFHGRHYDRLEDQADHLLIKPTIDRIFNVGDHSSISDDNDNIHWFKLNSDIGHVFNVRILTARPKDGPATGRVYVDPDGEQLSGGRIRAPRLGSDEAHRKYG